MSTISLVIILLFCLIWWVYLTVAFFRVDKPEARSNVIIVGNLIQSIFHVFLPFVPIIKAFDKTIASIEWNAYRFYSISFAGLVVAIVIVELATYFLG